MSSVASDIQQQAEAYEAKRAQAELKTYAQESIQRLQRDLPGMRSTVAVRAYLTIRHLERVYGLGQRWANYEAAGNA